MLGSKLSTDPLHDKRRRIDPFLDARGGPRRCSVASVSRKPPQNAALEVRTSVASRRL